MGLEGSVDTMLQQFEEFMGVSLFMTLLGQIPSMLVNLAVYIFTALALYTIAKRRGIHHAWLAWVPIANAWLLGCVSDQYRAVVRGETKNRRKVLLWTNVAVRVIAILMLVLLVVVLVNVLSHSMGNLENLDYMTDAEATELLAAVMGPLVGIVLMALAMAPLSIVYAVFSYIALYDVYKSCEPGNAALYLVLSIFFGWLKPVFLFLGRNKDDGMQPPRPAYYQPIPQEPVEPWKTEE